MRGELRELGGYFVEGHADALGEDNERDAAEHRPLVAALATAAAIRRDQAAVFIESQGGRGNSASTRNLANEHVRRIPLPALDFKFT
jgi:hypothetical protein